jgi:hypothetical protein
LYDGDNPNPNVTIGIYCCKSLKEDLHEEAERSGVKPSALGAEALRVFLSVRRKTRDFFGVSGEYKL